MAYFPKTKKTGAVVLAQISGGEYRSEYGSSLTSWIRYDLINEKRFIAEPKSGIINFNSGPRLGASRSSLIQTFLSTPDLKDAEWLMMIDSDMTWEPDAIDRLIATAEDKDARCVSGLCFGARTFDGEIFPTVYDLIRDDANRVTTARAENFPEDEPFTAGGTGAAMLLMHRSLLVDMGKPYPDGFGTLPDGTLNKLAWFAETATGPYDHGEDITFCIRLQAMGDKLWIDPTVRTGHIKTGEITYELWKERQELELFREHRDDFMEWLKTKELVLT